MNHIDSCFLDSGAFSLNTKAQRWQSQHNTKRDDYYQTPDYQDFVNAYISFVKKYKVGIDLYANMDVIGNAALTWKNQKYLERHGLHPVPVVHFGTDPDLLWVRRYVDSGYKMIGLGAMVGRMNTSACRLWLDKCFNYICDTPTRQPRVKVHGFGITLFRVLVRYPWWSVDSTAWLKMAAYGRLFVPRRCHGEFNFRQPPI